MVHDVVEILMLAGYLKKTYHRIFLTSVGVTA